MRKKFLIPVILMSCALMMSACGKENTVTENTTPSVEETVEVEEESTVPSTETAEESTKPSTEASTKKPVEETTKPSTEAPTKKPVEETTKPSTEAPTKKPTEQATEAPTQKPTEVPTQKPTEQPTQPAHTHSWSQATCTSPATCGCGATNGSALGHNWSQATCTSPSTCSRCGATNGSALGHNFGNNNQTCSNCGVNNPNYQAPHTHNWSTKSWTTTEETQELVDGRCCGGCGEWFATDAELTAHQEATAEASRQWAKDHPGATAKDAYRAGKIEHTGWASSGRCVTKTVTVTHHKRVCSCGTEEVID